MKYKSKGKLKTLSCEGDGGESADNKWQNENLLP